MGILLIYVVSPIDFVPEILFGPIGLIDDAIALIGAIIIGSQTFLKRMW